MGGRRGARDEEYITLVGLLLCNIPKDNEVPVFLLFVCACIFLLLLQFKYSVLLGPCIYV